MGNKTFLDPTEKKLLNLLVDNQDTVVTFEQIANLMPVFDYRPNIYVYICKLRKNIQGHILSRDGVGYLYTTRLENYDPHTASDRSRHV